MLLWILGTFFVARTLFASTNDASDLLKQEVDLVSVHPGAFSSQDALNLTDVYLKLFEAYPERHFYLRQAAENAQRAMDLSQDKDVFGRVAVLNFYEAVGENEKFSELLAESLALFPKNLEIVEKKILYLADQMRWDDFRAEVLINIASLKRSKSFLKVLVSYNLPDDIFVFLSRNVGSHPELTLNYAKNLYKSGQGSLAWDVVKSAFRQPLFQPSVEFLFFATRLSFESKSSPIDFSSQLAKVCDGASSSGVKSEALLLLGIQLYHQKKVAKASTLWLKGVVSADSLELYYGEIAAQFLKDKNYKSLKAFTAKVLESHPSAPLLLASLAEIKEELHEPLIESLHLYDDAIVLDDKRPEYFAGRAQLLQKLGHDFAALEDLVQLIKLDPNDAEALNAVVELENKLGFKTPHTAGGAALAH